MPLLDWLNKEQAITAVKRTKYRLLEEAPSLSCGDREAENLLIQGESLEALKALSPFYTGQVQCIYADPPFNTGQAFEDYDDNLEHSTWLSLMYPLLELQRELLSESGTIFLHIDDEQLAYLVTIADEVFGRKNRVSIATFKQGAATGHKAINPGMVSVTNFVIVYAKDKSKWSPNRIFTGRERDKRYTKFLLNPKDHYKDWRFGTVSSAFTEKMQSTMKALKDEFGDEVEDMLDRFVIEHADQVAQFVRPDYKSVSMEAQSLIDLSKESKDEIFLLQRENYSDLYFIGGQRIIFYTGKLKEVDGELVAGEPLTTLWADLLSNNLHNEGGVKFPKSKKPESLLKRCIELGSNEGDLVLDCFLGSGTTAAVAHKLKRRWIGIERGDHAQTKCLPRLKDVVDGEQSGVSKAVNWQGGGGFRFMRLGEAVFDEYGSLNPDIRFDSLAAHLWYLEAKMPMKDKPQGPLLGVHEDTAYYLLYNGVLGDRRPEGGNVLTTKVLNELPVTQAKRKVIYGESSSLGTARLKKEGVSFKQIPYDVGML